MLRRQLRLHVFGDRTPLRGNECFPPFDCSGNRGSDLCMSGLIANNRHSAVVRIFGRKLSRAAIVSTQYKVPNFVPGLDARPTDILVQEPAELGATALFLPVSFDVTDYSPTIYISALQSWGCCGSPSRQRCRHDEAQSSSCQTCSSPACSLP